MYIDNKMKEYSKKIENYILGTYLMSAFPNHIKSENVGVEDIGELFLSTNNKNSLKDFNQNIKFESGVRQADISYAIGSLNNLIENAQIKMESTSRGLRYNNVTDNDTIDRIFSERFNDIKDIVEVSARSEADMEIDSLSKHISVLLEDAVKERTKAREEEEEKKAKEKEQLENIDDDVADLENMINEDEPDSDGEDDTDGETDYEKLANDKYAEEEVKEEEEIDKELDEIPTGEIDEEEEKASKESANLPEDKKKEKDNEELNELEEEQNDIKYIVDKKEKLDEKETKKMLKRIYAYNHRFVRWFISAIVFPPAGVGAFYLIKKLLDITVWKEDRKKNYQQYYDMVKLIIEDKEDTIKSMTQRGANSDYIKKLKQEVEDIERELTIFERRYEKEFKIEIKKDTDASKASGEGYFLSQSDYVKMYAYSESTKEDQDEVISDLKSYQKDLTGDKAKDALSKIGGIAKDVAKMPINIAVSIAKTTYDMLVAAKVKRDAKRGPAVTHNKNISFALLCYKADIITADKWIDMTDKLLASGKGSDSQKKQLKEIKNYYEYFKKDSENKVKDIEKSIDANRQVSVSKESVNLLLQSQDDLVRAYSESFNGDKNLLNSSESFKESLHSQSMLLASFITFKEHFKLV